MTVRRFHAEIGTSIMTGALGLVAVIGALELGYGWTDSGPQAGYFPFYVGLILLGGSLWNLAAAFIHQRVEHAAEQDEPFLTREGRNRIGVFFGTVVAFVVATIFLGFYVGSTLYITWTAWRQGKCRLPVALLIGALFSASQYVLFEVIFKVPLLKGPIEPLLGIY